MLWHGAKNKFKNKSDIITFLVDLPAGLYTLCVVTILTCEIFLVKSKIRTNSNSLIIPPLLDQSGIL
uniref:Uncharacterized protein n=1 Tax=Rhizophora mucronata TaxID=61149 RepID=A0A2P2PSQ2_RHIMU